MAGRNEFENSVPAFFAQPIMPVKKAQSPIMARNQRSAFFDSGDVVPITAPLPAVAQKRGELQSRSSTSTTNLLEANAVGKDGINERASHQGFMVHPLPPAPLLETQTMSDSNPGAESENIDPERQENALYNDEQVVEDMTPAEALDHIRTHDVGEAFDRFSNAFNGILAEKHPTLTKHVDVMFNCNKIFHTHRTLLEHRRDGLHKRKVEALGSAENFRKKCMTALPDCLNNGDLEENELHDD